MYERFASKPSIIEKAAFAFTVAWWIYEAFTGAAPHRFGLALPSILVLYEVWAFFYAFYEHRRRRCLDVPGY